MGPLRVSGGHVLLDTNILIDVVNGVGDAHTELARYDAYAISRIAWIELLTGLKREEEFLLERIVSSMIVLEVSRPVAERAVQLRRTTKLKLADALIYATALEHGLVLLTRNTKDFKSDMPGVRVPYTL